MGKGPPKDVVLTKQTSVLVSCLPERDAHLSECPSCKEIHLGEGIYLRVGIYLSDVHVVVQISLVQILFSLFPGIAR